MEHPSPPTVSVVLPAFNAAATVGRAIASIQAQTLPTWELVVVDDGSGDSTTAVVQAAARQDSRIRLLSRPHEGIAAALNAGVAAARAGWIARMDADDEAHPARLAEQLGWARAHPHLGLVSCLVEFGGDARAQAGYALHVAWLNRLTSPEDIARNRFVESPLAHPSVMFRREVWDRHGGYRPGDFPEDYELWLRWLDAGVAMAKVPQVLLRWHDAPSRLSRRDPRYAPEAFFRVKAGWIARELARTAAGRAVWVWGAGRPTRRRAAELERAGVRVRGYVDIDPRKWTPALGGTGRPVVAPDALPRATEAFVLGYVSSRGARELIRDALRARGFGEGADFLMCA